MLNQHVDLKGKEGQEGVALVSMKRTWASELSLVSYTYKKVYCQNGQITNDNEANPTWQKRSSVTNSTAPLELWIKTSDVSSQVIKL